MNCFANAEVILAEFDFPVILVFIALAVISWVIKAIRGKENTSNTRRSSTPTPRQKQDSVEAFLENLLAKKKTPGVSARTQPPPVPPRIPAQTSRRRKQTSIGSFVKSSSSETLTRESIVNPVLVSPQLEQEEQGFESGIITHNIEEFVSDLSPADQTELAMPSERMQQAGILSPKPAKKDKPSQAMEKLNLDNPASLRQAVIFQTILGKPRALENESSTVLF